MSMTPTAAFILVIASILRAMRRARCTPRDRMPISTNSLGFVVFSTTSWAMRLKVLPSSSCSNRIRCSWLMAKKKTLSEFREGLVEYLVLKLLSSCNLFRSHRTELKGIIFCSVASIESQSKLHGQFDNLSGELAVLNEKFANGDGQFESSRSRASGIYEQNSITRRYRRFVGMATDDGLIASRHGITIQVLDIVNDI